MDPFEARLTLLKLVGRLNASSMSESILATFMMKHEDLKEDLYSCIVEELENVGKDNANMRNNVMWALTHLCLKIEEYSSKQKRKNQDDPPIGEPKDMSFYTISIMNDLVRLTTELVCSDDEIGQINKHSTLLVLSKLKNGKFGASAGKSEEALNQINKATDILHSRSPPKYNESNIELPMTRQQILKRMDEDRERSKVAREHSWVIGPDDDEFELQWEAFEGGFTKLDKYETQEENEMCEMASFGLDLPAAAQWLGQGKRRRVDVTKA